MSRAVFCITSLPQADAIIRNLQGAGFSGNDISVLTADKEGTRDFAHEHNTKAPEGAATGAGSGAILGGVIGWLAGVGTLAIPGLGPFIAAGPIMAALSGATVGGAIGGVAGALIGMGMPEFEAKKYEGKIRSGSCLIAVHSENGDEVDRAEAICKQAGASDITTSRETAVAGGSRY